MKNQTAVDTVPSSALRNLPFAKLGQSHAPGNKATSKHLGSTVAAVDAIYLSPISRTISYEAELGYTTLDDVLGGIIGTPTTTGNGTTTAYTNVYAPQATPKYKYMQIVDGDIPTGYCVGYKNCLATEVTISFSADNPIGTVSTKFVGQPSTAIPAGGATIEALVTSSLVTVSHIPALVKHFTVWNLGVGTDTGPCLTSGTIKFSREFDDKIACVGPTGYKPAVYTAPLVVSMEFELLYDDAGFLAALENQTVLTGTDLKIVGGSIVGTTTPAAFYTIEIKSAKSLTTAWDLPIESNGRLKQKVTTEGYGNTGTGLTYDAVGVSLTSNQNGAVL